MKKQKFFRFEVFTSAKGIRISTWGLYGYDEKSCRKEIRKHTKTMTGIKNPVIKLLSFERGKQE